MTLTSAETMRAHRRQFVIGPEPMPVFDDWIARKLAPTVWISHCPALPAGWQKDRDGTQWCLLGVAVQTLDDRGAPLPEIAQAASPAVSGLRHNWAGRWVLASGSQLFLDASGLLGCYYGQRGTNSWISSSPALMHRILSGPDPVDAESPLLHYRSGIDWFPPPRSRFPDIRRLLPSQWISPTEGETGTAALLPPIDPTRPFEEVVGLIGQSLNVTLEQLAASGAPLSLGLTAGADSRAVMAICKAAGINIKSFTRITARMSVADGELPPLLAACCGFSHEWTRSKRVEDRRLQIAFDHSRGNVSRGDMKPFLTGDRDDLDGIAIGGHAFEVFSYNILSSLPDSIESPDRLAHDIACMFRRDRGAGILDAGTVIVRGLSEWLQWVLQHPEAHLDWRERFYLEQDNAGWLSSKEQIYDLNRVVRFPLLNAARNYSILLGLPPGMRRHGQIQSELIRRSAPELLDFPINPPDHSFGFRRLIRNKGIHFPSYLGRKLSWHLRTTWHALRSSQ